MSVLINQKLFPAEYLSNPEEIQRGMMERDSLDGCMVFKMGKGHHSFWMKNCLIPLDIVFVLNNRISRIHRNCQPCDGECQERFTGIGDHVLEFPANSTDEFKVGDRVRMYLGSPMNPVK
jgi:uncharacterized membrane protein (UPF0127 family)